MTIEYKYKFIDDDPEFVQECACCGAEVPLATFGEGNLPGDDVMELCEICATSMVNNFARYPKQHGRDTVELGKAMACIANLVIDKCTGRSPSGSLPDEDRPVGSVEDNISNAIKAGGMPPISEEFKQLYGGMEDEPHKHQACKDAHAAGAQIEHRYRGEIWVLVDDPKWYEEDFEYRVKPEPIPTCNKMKDAVQVGDGLKGAIVEFYFDDKRVGYSMMFEGKKQWRRIAWEEFESVDDNRLIQWLKFDHQLIVGKMGL